MLFFIASSKAVPADRGLQRNDSQEESDLVLVDLGTKTLTCKISEIEDCVRQAESVRVPADRGLQRNDSEKSDNYDSCANRKKVSSWLEKIFQNTYSPILAGKRLYGSISEDMNKQRQANVEINVQKSAQVDQLKESQKEKKINIHRQITQAMLIELFQKNFVNEQKERLGIEREYCKHMREVTNTCNATIFNMQNKKRREDFDKKKRLEAEILKKKVLRAKSDNAMYKKSGLLDEHKIPERLEARIIVERDSLASRHLESVMEENNAFSTQEVPMTGRSVITTFRDVFKPKQLGGSVVPNTPRSIFPCPPPIKLQDLKSAEKK
jgi:hypothetical protein